MILAESHLGRDSLVGAALVLERLAQEPRSLSAVKAQMPSFHIVKDKISVEGYDPQKMIEGLGRRYPDAEVNTVDGLKLQWEDRWVHVRPSNTEPIIRIIAEGPTADIARELVAGVRSTMGKADD